MKLKLMITLVVMALVFGMVIAACDNGDLQFIPKGDHETIIDRDSNLIPYIDNNTIKGNQGSTTDNSTIGVPIPSPYYVLPPPGFSH